jgi:hypothetical protein
VQENFSPFSYSYRVYGLGIASTDLIPGLEPLAPGVAPCDVSLNTGPEPDWAQQRTNLFPRIVSHLPETEDAADPSFLLTEYGEGRFFELAYSDGTRFVVDGAARRVWGSFHPPNTTADLATYFLGPVMGFLLRKRHVTSLHASCVGLNGRAVALCGHAGFGKSTTAAALALRGFPVLAEDIVPLEEANGNTLAVPGYPRVCLWPDAVAKLLGASATLPQLTPIWEKCYLPLDGLRANFSREKLPLGIIYLFGPRSDGDTPRVEQMGHREALLHLVQNTYMNWLLDRQQRAAEFDMLSRLVRNITVRRIVPSSDAEKLGALCSLIESDASAAMAREHPPYPSISRSIPPQE